MESKGVSAAVHQIFAGKSVAKEMRTCFRDASALIIAGNSLAESAFIQLIAAFVAEQIVLRQAAANLLILAKNTYHLPTQGDNLNLLVFVVASKNLVLIQMYITIFNGANS